MKTEEEKRERNWRESGEKRESMRQKEGWRKEELWARISCFYSMPSVIALNSEPGSGIAFCSDLIGK